MQQLNRARRYDPVPCFKSSGTIRRFSIVIQPVMGFHQFDSGHGHFSRSVADALRSVGIRSGGWDLFGNRIKRCGGVLASSAAA